MVRRWGLELGWGSLILISIVLVLIYRKRESEEAYLGIKVIGYYLLGSFTFNFNMFPIPLGYIIYLMFFKPTQNRKIKNMLVNFGLVVFFAIVIIPRVEVAIYERDINLDISSRNVNELNLYDDLQRTREKFDLIKFVGLTDFTMAYDETGNINYIDYTLKVNNNGDNIKYYISYGRNERNDGYTIRRLKNDNTNEVFKVEADTFLEKVDLINDLNSDKVGNNMCIFLAGFDYDITKQEVLECSINDKIIYIDELDKIRDISTEKTDVSGIWIKEHYYEVEEGNRLSELNGYIETNYLVR